MPTKAQYESSKRRRELKLARCSQCQKDKPWEDFTPCPSRRPFGLSSLCIPCDLKRKAKQKRDKYAAAPEKELARRRKTTLMKHFGITVDDYETLLRNQNGVCAICEQPETAIHGVSREVKRLAVDHNHHTGEVRGLLCSNCNRGLGFFNEDAARMLIAIKYLEKEAA